MPLREPGLVLYQKLLQHHTEMAVCMATWPYNMESMGLSDICILIALLGSNPGGDGWRWESVQSDRGSSPAMLFCNTEIGK